MTAYTKGHNKETANMTTPLLGTSVQSRDKEEQTRYGHSNLRERRERGGGEGKSGDSKRVKDGEQRGWGRIAIVAGL